MRASVVINTCNRGPSLRRSLQALRHQTYADFEVVVVNGPSTDDTEEVLEEFAGTVRVGSFSEMHLSRSRNIGIALAAGDVVAFLDDDAIPEPTWLAELLAVYDSWRVGGAGGVVYDHTGFRLQYHYATCDRTGGARFEVAPPSDTHCRPGADPFVYLQGTNASFRRRCLEEIGGFDEEIEYYLDEVEVCMRILDAGYTLRPLPRAAVHHKYLASHLRSPQKVILNPYPLVKNRCYFALQNGLRTRTPREVRRTLAAYADGLRSDCQAHFAAGRMDADQRRLFLEQLDRGLCDGTARGLQGERRRQPIPSADERDFLPYPVVRPAGTRLTLCLIDQEQTEGEEDFRGIAARLAEWGHEVHTVTRSPDTNRVDFEDGVWVHRLAACPRHVPALEPYPWCERLYRAAAVYREVDRIHGRGPLDSVLLPLPAGDGLLCPLDDRFLTLLLASPNVEETTTHRGGSLDGAVLRQSDSAVRCPLPPFTAVQAEGLLGLCRAALRNQRPAAQPSPRPHPTRAIGGHLAAALAEVGGLAHEAARRAAEALLDPACYPVDYPAALLRLWPGPDEDFLESLFRVLLGREVDPPSRERFVRLLRRGMPRRAVVRHLALSREAGESGLPLGWLASFRRLTLADPPPPRRVRLLDRLRVLATRLAWAAKHRLRPRSAPGRRAG
jgi:GT2 family glycosyltransferase